MADTKVSALTAVASAVGTHELPVNEAGASKKATVAQVTTYVNANIALGAALNVNSQEISSAGGTDITLHSDNDVEIILGDAIGADDFNIRDSANAIVASINSDGAITAVSYGGITEANLLDLSASETITGATWTFNNIVLATGKALQTSTSAGNTAIIQAYDVDGTAYTTFATLTANNTPTMDLSTAVTIGGNAFYYVGGTDVAVADGGTGSSTAAGAATNLGLGTGDSPQFTAVNIGHATDTTVTRASAGDLNVEGNIVYRAGGTDVPVADGGTGSSTAGGARTNLGLVIGTDVQAYDADLLTLATSFTSASAAGAASLALHEDTDNGTNKLIFKAAAAMVADVTLVFPDTDGDASQVLTTDGAGALSWATPAGGGNVSNTGTPVDNQVAVWTSATVIEGTAGFTWDGSDHILYEAVNDGNPQIRLGAADAEEVHIQTVYDGVAQTLNYVLFTTDVASVTADKGLYRFNVDGTDILDVDDGGINFAASKGISIAGTDIITDAAGTATLSNIDALDATTEATIEAAIDTLANLTAASALVTVGTVTSGTWASAVGTITGTIDAGGATSFEVPNGAGGTTVDATGEVCVDSTSKTVNFYDGAAEKVLQPEMSKAITVETPTATEDISMFWTDYAITVTKMVCVMVGSSPSVTWTVRHHTDRSNVGNEVVTGGTTTTSTTTGSVVTSFNDATIPADSFVWLETTATSGTVTNMNLTILYTQDA